MDGVSVMSSVGCGNKPKVGSRGFWMAFCLTLPVLTQVLLPSSFEKMLEFQFFGVPCFLPLLLLFVFLAGAKKNQKNKSLKLLFGLQFVFMLIGFVYNLNNYGNNPMAFLLAGNYYYYVLLLGLYCQLGAEERYWVGKFYAITLFMLGFEVILLGLGIVKGFGAVVVADEAQEFSDFFRVTTTAGAATGTAVHLYLLTVICILLSDSQKWRIVFFVFGVSTTILTISRGGAVAFVLYFVMWLFYRVKERKKNRFKVIFGAVAAVALLYYVGVFNPLMERMELKTQDDTMLESREDRAGAALLIYNRTADSKLLGLGQASLYRSSELRHTGIDNVVAPHNSYVQTLCEQGIIGLVLMIIFWLTFLFINRSNSPILMSIIPLLLVLWNTESVVVTQSDYLISLAIIMMLALDKYRQHLLHTV
jgi:O-antigen ligase